MTPHQMAALIRTVLLGDPIDQAGVDNLTVGQVRSDGHGTNFIVRDPDDNPFRIIVTEP